MSPTKDKSKSTTAKGNKSTRWTDEEKAAMRDRARELKAEARWRPDVFRSRGRKGPAPPEW